MARRPKQKPSGEKDNFQDKAEEKEFNKGYKAGEEAKSASNKDAGNDRGKQNSAAGDSKKSAVAIYTGAANPIEMHSISPELLDPIARVVVQLRSGWPQALQIQASTGTEETQPQMIEQPIGGIMNMKYIPSIGVTQSSEESVNLGDITTFNAVRAKTGGTQYYEAPDLGIYNIAMSQCYAYYALMCKLYGLLKNYKYENMYVPKAIINSMGIDADDLTNHPEDFRGWINLFAHDIEQLRMPTGFEYLNRQIWMNSNVYLDAPENNGQLYNFVPMAFFQLQEGISAHSYQYYYKKQVAKVNYDLWYLKLIPAPWSSDGVNINTKTQGLATFEDLRAFGKSLLAPCLDSQDFAYISAGYERAFTDFMQVNPISEMYSVEPVYNESVLAQIENATTLPPNANYEYTIQEDVTVNAGHLISDFKFAYTPTGQGLQFMPTRRFLANFPPSSFATTVELLNRHDKRELDPEFIMESTRMITPTTTATEAVAPDAAQNNCVNNNYTGANAVVDGANVWQQLGTYGSNILLGYHLCEFRYSDVNKPWGKVIANNNAEALCTDMFTVDTTANLTGTYASTATNYLLDIGNLMQRRKRLQAALNLLSQWDWHPKVRVHDLVLTGDYNTGPNVVMKDNYLYQAQDIATFGRLTMEVLAQLNSYDLMSQFSNKQVGGYAVK